MPVKIGAFFGEDLKNDKTQDGLAGKGSLASNAKDNLSKTMAFSFGANIRKKIHVNKRIVEELDPYKCLRQYTDKLENALGKLR